MFVLLDIFYHINNLYDFKWARYRWIWVNIRWIWVDMGFSFQPNSPCLQRSTEFDSERYTGWISNARNLLKDCLGDHQYTLQIQKNGVCYYLMNKSRHGTLVNDTETAVRVDYHFVAIETRRR